MRKESTAKTLTEFNHSLAKFDSNKINFDLISSYIYF